MSAPNPQSSPTSAVYFSCFSGPDQGKRAALGASPLIVGRVADCNLLSDDAEVAPRHVVLTCRDGVIRFRAFEPAMVHVDGHAQLEGLLSLGQQLRIGRSVWQVAGAGPRAAGSLFDRLGAQISSAAGVERLSTGFSPRELFSEVLKDRSDEEAEEYFIVGTRSTTPSLALVSAGWPRPWAFFRTFTLSILVYLGFVMAWNEFRNPLLLPGLLLTGSFAVPLSILIFFFEMNVLKNVSLYQVIRLLFMGGILSIVVSLFGFRWTGLSDWLGAMSAGIVEETGKALTLILVVHRRKYRWTLNGLLFGATVGTGFAVFETAGYAFDRGLLEGGIAAMLQVITLRGVLSILGGHALFTGLVGAALWRIKGDGPFHWELLRDSRFLRVFGLAVALHMLWNSPISLPFYLKYLALGFVAWIALLSFIQDGLRQVRREQKALESTMTSGPPSA